MCNAYITDLLFHPLWKAIARIERCVLKVSRWRVTKPPKAIILSPIPLHTKYQTHNDYSRLGRSILKHCGIGEVQSPPGASARAKTAALGQAGIE